MKCSECGFEFDEQKERSCPECGCPVSEMSTPHTEPVGDMSFNCPSCGMQLSHGTYSCPHCGLLINEWLRHDRFSDNKKEKKPASESSVPSRIKKVYNENKESAQKQVVNGFITLLLLVIAVSVGYLAYTKYRESNSSSSMDSSRRVLVVEIDNSLIDSDKSDSTQIKNALSNGGMMRLEINDLDPSLKQEYYGATDSNSSYWVFGAVVNYISSEGWELVQAPSGASGLGLYFFKK